MDDWRAHSHRRYNPLTGEWVLVSPHRLDRPWRGETAPPAPPHRERYDPACYLCPGNARANGASNPPYEATYVFKNDFPALLADVPGANFENGLLRACAERGECRVICFSPRHDLDIAQMDVPQIRRIVDTWAQQYEELGGLPYVNAVTLFENRGAMMGASNPHPHGQVWSGQSIPTTMERESRAQLQYAHEHGTCLLCAYVRQEIEAQTRVVYANDHACVIVPFWAVWPFEALVLPRAHARSLTELGSEQRDALAEAIQALTSRYDRLFSIPFPYSMGFHQQPTDGRAHEQWHVHAHYFPPLLRSASVRKFMVGYEMLAEPQRDIPAEAAAERLRNA